MELRSYVLLVKTTAFKLQRNTAKGNTIISYTILTFRRILNHKAVYKLLSASLDILTIFAVNIKRLYLPLAITLLRS
jgi:hypothetical protein